MKSFLHAKGSAVRWGGKPADYMHLHDFLDQTKMAMPDMRHRAILHNAFGCFLVERVFGHTLINSDGREVSTRDVAENHIIEDLGFLPSVEDWLDELPLSKWHGGIHRLPKDERPPTPAEKRDDTRRRVQQALDNNLPRTDGCPASMWLEPGGLDAIIAAATGASEHQDDD